MNAVARYACSQLVCSTITLNSSLSGSMGDTPQDKCYKEAKSYVFL